ncbi:transcriptional regulator [Limoniibacter endophyticus]|uniref:Transcriptional regulator n=1 Tax=Limoniibacter endophyticus TaxID=1565040 RepID=A0A8J3GI50_9HYPH|nr:transcriptional regulator [Limoniibacter endophyticus]GHC75970.1 transcriptional regulator [Limoniibacter endophyticus]
MNDNEEKAVTIIIGRVQRDEDGPQTEVHVLLVAPDDDTAVHNTLEALKAEGYAFAELDQIGEMQEEPDEEPYASAYQGALEGEIAVVKAGEIRR